MSKIEIFGPRQLLRPVFSRLRQFGVLHLKERPFPAEDYQDQCLKSLEMDARSVDTRIAYETLKQKIETLLTRLPEVPVASSPFPATAALEEVEELIDEHSRLCDERLAQYVRLLRQREDLEKAANFFSALAPLIGEIDSHPSLEFIGLELSDPAAMAPLTALVKKLTENRYDLRSAPLTGKKRIVLIVVQKQQAATVKQALQQENLPEFPLPENIAPLPFEDKLSAIQQLLEDNRAQAAEQKKQLDLFAENWQGNYRLALDQINNELPLLEKTALLYETAMCFFIFGWIPSRHLARVRSDLEQAFNGQVVVEQKAILEQELDTVPVALKNSRYFEPFELFSRLLPLPSYTSYDPTLFLGIFFPLFFGMILGDLGYGALLLTIALGLIFFCRRKSFRDAGKILAISALYTLFFGWLFGECFGEFGSRLLGLEPIIFNRRTAIMPMLYFALSVGVCHLLLGLLLGLLSAFRQRKHQQALLKFLTLFIILCLLLLLGTHFVPDLMRYRGHLLIAFGIAMPLVLLTGGLLAPLELLKTIGHIISYARIMAIGLTSVLLAYVANELAGVTGDLLLGFLVAFLLHAFNLVLGVFAPTIHSLRLHFVEFFGKFMQSEGKKYKPMK